MRPGLDRYGLVPVVTAALALIVGATTFVEQERQYDTVRAMIEAHARLVGGLVRVSAQQATLSTDLLYTLTARGLDEAAALLGPAPRQAPCGALREAGLAVWATRHDDGLHGCFGAIPEGRRGELFDAVIGADDPRFVDQGPPRDLGLVCSAAAFDAPTVVCREGGGLDALRREVGLGPLLAGLRGGGLLYVVLQDAGGLLASSPGAGPVSAWADDPELQAMRDAATSGVSGRILPGREGVFPVYEALGAVLLGDGSRAVVRVGLDASALVLLRERIEARHLVMAAVLATAVGLSAALALALSRAGRRRREHAEELRRRDEEARHWQTLGRLAATVAHEVRNPLNALGMALQRLRVEIPVAEADREEYTGLLQVAVDSADRVERVVSEFLDLGRPLVVQPAVCDVRDLLEQVVAPLSLQAGHVGATLGLEVVEQATARVDRRRFGQILTNLVANALDAVGRGGTVQVAASVEGHDLVVRVVDDGPGMDAAGLEAALTPFVTSKSSGTGLGLPLARRLAEAHGGTLALTSTPGRGTIATVRIPGAAPVTGGGGTT